MKCLIERQHNSESVARLLLCVCQAASVNMSTCQPSSSFLTPTPRPISPHDPTFCFSLGTSHLASLPHTRSHGPFCTTRLHACSPRVAKSFVSCLSQCKHTCFGHALPPCFLVTGMCSSSAPIPHLSFRLLLRSSDAGLLLRS